MGSTNHGLQTIVHQYFEEAIASQWGKRHKDIRPRGIYSGGYLTRVDDDEVTLSPLVVEIGDTTLQISVRTADVYTLNTTPTLDSGSIAPATPYIVLRWSYVATPANYMEIRAIASVAAAQANDIIVGKCVFVGSTLTEFDYADRTFLNVQNLFLKVEPSEAVEMYVRVRAGRIQNTTGYVSIADQKVGPFSVPGGSNSRIDLVYVDTDGTVGILQGTAAVSPSAPFYGGKLVLAEVRIVNGDTSILASRIIDVRSFLNNPEQATTYNIVPRWSARTLANVDYTLPSQFTSGFDFDIISFGKVSISSVSQADEWTESRQSTLFTMKVNSNGAQIKTLRLYMVNQKLYVYNNSGLVFSRASAYNGNASTYLIITLNLVNGLNTIQMVWNNYAGGEAYVSLIGNVVDGQNVLYVAP